MKRKLCSICLAVMVFSLTIGVFAAGGRVYFSDLTQSTTSVSVKARYDGTGTQSVWLIAAYVNSRGVVTAINQDHVEIEAGNEETLTVTIDDRHADSTLKCFLWDRLNGRTPLENVAPAPVTELASSDQTADSVSLNWTAADDDYASVASYNIYNMGMKVGSTTDTAFTDQNRERGVMNSYEVRAVDSEGLESPKAAALAIAAANIPTVILDGDNIITDGRLDYTIAASASYYGFTAATEADGLACRKTVNPLEDGFGSRNIITRHPFNFSADYAAEIAQEKKFTFVMTYFDDGVGQIRMEYCKVGNQADSLGGGVYPVTTQNSGQWKTVVFSIADGNFGELATSEGNSFAKLRIYGSSSKNFKIYSLSMAPTSEYEALMKNAVARVDGAYINDGILLNLNTDEAVKTKLSDQGAALVSAGNVLACDVTDTTIAGSSAVHIEVEYFTEVEEEEIVLQYNSTSEGSAKEVRQKATAAGEWRRMCFELSDARFSNAISCAQLSAGADFTLGTSSGAELYIHSVRVYIPR